VHNTIQKICKALKKDSGKNVARDFLRIAHILGENSMKTLLNAVLHQVRTLVVFAGCALLIFSSTLPANAANTAPKSAPDGGEAQLHRIIEKSEDAAQSGMNSMQQVAERSSKGLNEVQADADFKEMKRPENTQATSVIDQVKEAMKKAAD
jgi:hypothetical protein